MAIASVSSDRLAVWTEADAVHNPESGATRRLKNLARRHYVALRDEQGAFVDADRPPVDRVHYPDVVGGEGLVEVDVAG